MWWTSLYFESALIKSRVKFLPLVWSHGDIAVSIFSPTEGGAFINQNTEANTMETVIIMISPTVLLLEAENHLHYYT